jgi:hypothetical protein
LNEWADKLEAAVHEREPGHRPLAQSALDLLKNRQAAAAPSGGAGPPSQPASSGFGNSVSETGSPDSTLEEDRPPKPRDPDVPRYVGGIR